MQIFSAPNYDFIRWRWHALILSLAVIGSIVAVPIGGASGRFGAWEIHGGVEFYRFGDFGKLRNQGDANRIVGSAGLGLRY